MAHKACRPGLKSVRNTAIVIIAGRDIPPKLPDTTNLVFTRSKNEYREIIAMTESVMEENRSPPLKKLTGTINKETKVCTAIRLTLSPKTILRSQRMTSRATTKGGHVPPHVIE
jgi:hypothetical protein